MQQAAPGQVGGARRLLPGQVVGCADRDLLLVEQLVALQVRPAAMAVENGHVDVLLVQVEGLDMVANAQVDVRIGVLEVRQLAGQPAGPEGRQAGDSQHLALAALGHDGIC